MIYVDTSVIVKLYFKEEYSREASNWFRKQGRAIPLTPFHELEFTNAIKLKRFRKEMAEEEAEIVLKRFHEHERKGVFYRPQIHWADAFSLAIDLSRTHTERTGARSLDVIHVASALAMGADGFTTFDQRQSKLAVKAGLRIEDCRKKPKRRSQCLATARSSARLGVGVGTSSITFGLLTYLPASPTSH